MDFLFFRIKNSWVIGFYFLGQDFELVSRSLLATLSSEFPKVGPLVTHTYTWSQWVSVLHCLCFCRCSTTGLATLNQASESRVTSEAIAQRLMPVMRIQLSFPHLLADGCRPFRYISRTRLASALLVVAPASCASVYRKRRSKRLEREEKARILLMDDWLFWNFSVFLYVFATANIFLPITQCCVRS